jgi:hypothetical protein
MAIEAIKKRATAQTFSLGSGLRRRYFKVPKVVVMGRENKEDIKLRYGTLQGAGIV